ncbi:MAG: DedA family protein [Candidatus Binatia bacterium]|nr:DedA family protein [Candidatus Binatia bacterium]
MTVRSDVFLFLPDFSPYVTIFLLLTLGIWVIPFAEEIALVTAGYLYYAGEVQLAAVLGVTSVGVFLGDFFAFWLGRRVGNARLERVLTVLGSGRWGALVGRFMERYGIWALFWSRFVPGIRLPAHLFVGMHGMQPATYARVSFLSVVVYVPFLFTLAYACGDEIETGLAAVRSLGHLAWGLLLCALGAGFLLRVFLSRAALALWKPSLPEEKKSSPR